MPDEQAASEVTDLGAIEGTEGGPASPELNTVPVTEVKPEDIGSLSLHYADGVPQLVVSGGTVIPAGIRVVDASGAPVAVYALAPALSARSASEDFSKIEIWEYDIGKDDFTDSLISVDEYYKASEFKTLPLR